MFVKMLRYILLIALFTLFGAPNALAFPWDRDMARQQSYKANEIARSPVEGTVPIGRRAFNMTADEAEQKLKNPIAFNHDSVWRGKRLYSSNCTVCHGENAKGETFIGPQMGTPSLLSDFYKNRKDGRVFAVIYNGGANMPRYGYKFSEDEHWHIVNYLRFLQGKDMPGIERPE